MAKAPKEATEPKTRDVPHVPDPETIAAIVRIRQAADDCEARASQADENAKLLRQQAADFRRTADDIEASA